MVMPDERKEGRDSDPAHHKNRKESDLRKDVWHGHPQSECVYPQNALDGYCLNLDLPQLRRMSYLLQNCSNNLNQVAKRVNESNQLYAADIEDLRHRLDELIGIGKQILSKLSEL